MSAIVQHQGSKLTYHSSISPGSTAPLQSKIRIDDVRNTLDELANFIKIAVLYNDRQ